MTRCTIFYDVIWYCTHKACSCYVIKCLEIRYGVWHNQLKWISALFLTCIHSAAVCSAQNMKQNSLLGEHRLSSGCCKHSHSKITTSPFTKELYEFVQLFINHLSQHRQQLHQVCIVIYSNTNPLAPTNHARINIHRYDNHKILLKIHCNSDV